jgi:N-methylhydantoinase B
MRLHRHEWLEEDPEAVAERYRSGDLELLDVLRHHGVILDWGTGELLPRTTEQFRAMLQRRAARRWETVPAGAR